MHNTIIRFVWQCRAIEKYKRITLEGGKEGGGEGPKCEVRDVGLKISSHFSLSRRKNSHNLNVLKTYFPFLMNPTISRHLFELDCLLIRKGLHINISTQSIAGDKNSITLFPKIGRLH